MARHIWVVSVAGSPVIYRRRAAFSALLRRPGLRASSDGVLATKSERKMLASRGTWGWLRHTFSRSFFKVNMKLIIPNLLQLNYKQYM